MSSNSFGNIFRVTTFGETHGPAMGCVIDGCPSGIKINEKEINEALRRRAPGLNPWTSPRKEPDQVKILSGVFEGVSTGMPICLLIENRDADPSKYTPIKNLLRPGHANFTFLHKYGIFDYRGGGRSSARETVARVAAGAIASKILREMGVEVRAYLKQVGGVGPKFLSDVPLRSRIDASPIFAPEQEKEMRAVIDQAKQEGDSLGGVVEAIALNVPIGWGDPVYEKIEANLAKAMLSIPASKGFEIGEGFEAARMRGSSHNDEFMATSDGPKPVSNHAGGTLGGISTGEPICFRVAFKPTSSIQKVQQTSDLENRPQEFRLPEGSRHDPCLAIRAVPVVEAMTVLTLVDAYLLSLSSQQMPALEPDLVR